MKKLLAALCLASLTTFVHAQGYIQFQGTAAAISTNGTVASPYQPFGVASGTTIGRTVSSSISGDAFYYELLYAPGGTNGWTDFSLYNASWTPVTTYSGSLLIGTNNLIAGNFSGNGGSSGIQVDLNAGVSYNVILVGWSSSLGSNWTSIYPQLEFGIWTNSGYFGNTTIGTVTPFATAGAGDPSMFAGTWPNGSMTLYNINVPEPTTVALAGLGGLSLLLFRKSRRS